MNRSAAFNLPFQHYAMGPIPIQVPLLTGPGPVHSPPPMMPAAPVIPPPMISAQQPIKDEAEPPKPKSLQLPTDKHFKRQIANYYERRRLESINTGFEALMTQMPHIQGEKLSKAAILQHAADLIYNLSHEKTKLISKNRALKMLAAKHGYLDQANRVESSSLQTEENETTEDEEELEQIYAAHEEMWEIDRERRARLYLERANLLQTEQPQEQTESIVSGNQSGKWETSQQNLDPMLKAIHQGDAFSHPTTTHD